MNVQLTGSDRNGSPLFTRSAGVNSLFCWSPFGGSAPRSGSSVSLPGFNGERQDPLSGVTHLGNGYRAYSPMLRRFACPDSESPFGVGGINPYVYCDNDPINRTDPSGHGPITWLIRKVITLGLRITLEEVGGMSAALSTTGMIETGLELASSASTGIASGVMKKKGNPEMAQKLGWASMGLGLAGGFGLATGEAAVIGQSMQGLSEKIRRALAPDLQIWGKGEPVRTVFTYKEKLTMGRSKYYEDAGYIANIDGNETSVLVMHGVRNKREQKFYAFYLDGTVEVNRKEPNLVAYQSAQELFDGLIERGIDLSIGEGPLHFVACKLGNSPFVEDLAKITNRTVVSYGNQRTVNTSNLKNMKLRGKKQLINVNLGYSTFLRARAYYHFPE